MGYANSSNCVKIFRYVSYFQLSSHCLDIPIKYCPSRLIDYFSSLTVWKCCQRRLFVFNILHKSLTLTTLLNLFDVEISRFQALKYYFVEVYCKTKFIEKSVKQRQKFGYNDEKQNFGITRKKETL